MSTILEKDWTTKAGLRAVVLMTSMGHRCGYVGIDASHPLHGVDYSATTDFLRVTDDEEVGKRGAIAVMAAAFDESRLTTPELYFNVHGGITYSGGSADYPAPSDGLWWYGYDCAHAGDCASDEYFAEQRVKYPRNPIFWYPHADDEHRTLEYCIAECESLAKQIAGLVRTRCQACDGRGRVNADHKVDDSGRTVACTVPCDACNGEGSTP